MSADACKTLLDLAARLAPGAEALARATTGRSGNTRFAVNDITTAGMTDDTGARLTLAVGKRHASAETNQTDDASLEALVKRTLAMAKASPEDPEWMGVLGAHDFPPSPAAYDATTEALSPDRRAEAAKLAIARAKDKELSIAGFYETHGAHTRLWSSAGLRASHASSIASLTMTARTPDGEGSGWSGAEEVRASDVDAGALAHVAADKGARSHGPKALAPGRYTVVLEPAAVGDLMGFFFDALDARRADEGRSFFAKPGGGTRIGEKLFASAVTLRSDPLDPATPGRTWDGEGMPLARTTWVEGGKLQNLNYSRYWAKKQGKAPTGAHATWHLSGGAAASVDALVAKVDRGLLVTRFWYTRWVDPQTMLVTGLTRDGVFWIEKGKVTHPVNNFRFNESPAAVLKNLVGMTKPTWRIPWWDGGVVRVPAVLARDFHMASVSAAV